MNPTPSDFRILTFEPEVQRQLTLFVRAMFAPEDAILQAVRQRTTERGLPQIAIRPEEGQMLQFLASLVGARRILEIGTLAGYSGIWLARALPPDGELVTLELDPKHAQVAREHFQMAGVAERVRLVEGEAMHTLTHALADARFDMVFVDADKTGYPDYLAWSVEHVRAGGLIAAHNAFRGGQLFADDPRSQATRQMLEAMAAHRRLLSTIIPVGDGIAVAQVLPEA